MASDILNSYINEINQEIILTTHINKLESNIESLKDIIGEYMEIDNTLKLKDKNILNKIKQEDLQNIKNNLYSENYQKDIKIKELDKEINDIIFEDKLVNKEKIEMLKDKEKLELQLKNIKVYIYNIIL
jgi:hypothetical protein